ncbi:2-oxoglutarate ferredoxin oxidoreductase, subunit B [Candidatus Desulfofervidus auxilii]|uniref:2-oxoglutarate ferredoxin oxidoreductase, subunit B n=1 Tax=Desulfofervidus auxilii TaxID=1621989 RepID=A0A7U4QKM0_DESA2|nr:2-oxoacid:acceptor oxidoreductase family protein [Candidatus Desulfofervidus auxilii]AMM41081.1 2-oxoglutarate ferredoxin oxidoreductase, subunit B [Candidatus Desulfofervidus auxilii]CAD7777762.1 hypothetical protein DMNBHIDG_01569 [Candidatus Methanoperedenaceae archaeon GB37]
MKPLEKKHPLEVLIRTERMPHIFCSGCGIGTVLTSFVEALLESELNLDKVAVCSGIGCSSRVPGYLKLDGFHTTHGRSVAFATGLKLSNPELTVFIFAGDGDLVAIGGNHLIHAARRNIDMKVICINNFNYGMTGGQSGPTTPLTARTTTSMYGTFEEPFNLVHLMWACGAVYVARWTAAHPHYIKRSISEALERPGFCFIEVITPCPTNWGRRNKMRTGIDMTKFFLERTVVKVNPEPTEAGIDMKNPIVCGVFVDKERPDFIEALKEQVGKKVKVYEFRGDGKAEPPEVPLKISPKPLFKKKLKDIYRVKIAGLGGQGMGLLGLIIGRAATVFDGNEALYSQEYGPEARGGASSAAIIISEKKVDVPYFAKPDVLIIMAQAAFRKYKKFLHPGSILIVDSELVKVTDIPEGVKVYKLPATRMAEKLGRSIVANIVILGFFTAITDIISLKAAKEALKISVPKGTEEFNLKAFENGYDYGKGIKKEGE